MTLERQKWKNGAVLQVDAHGHSCLAQMLTLPEIAFFDPSCPDRVLFRLWVHKSAYTTGRWLIVDQRPITDELSTQVPRFKKDPISGKLSIYLNERETPATQEECLKLESAAVWDPEHVEDRLRDHCENRENVWVKSLSLANGA